jgi:hypothetical protein
MISLVGGHWSSRNIKFFSAKYYVNKALSYIKKCETCVVVIFSLFCVGLGEKCCENIAKFLVHELQGKFLNHQLMLALATILSYFLVDHFDDFKLFYISA